MTTIKIPRWLTVVEVLSFHTKQIREHGGVVGVRDKGLLKSALAKPQHLFSYSTADIFSLATSYAYVIVKNHPFIDGNKRTAITSAGIFLILNEYMLEALEVEVVTYVTELAAGNINQNDFEIWLKENSQKIS